jgi:phosphatidate cytidylyltransferase
MALNWPTFFTRLGSAIVFCVIMMTGLLWNAWSFLVLVMLIQALALREYFRLMPQIFPDTPRPRWLQPVVQVCSLLLLYLIAAHPFYPAPGFPGVPLWPLLLCLPTTLLIAAGIGKRSSLQAGIEALCGICYIVVPMALFLSLYAMNPLLPLILILMIWTNDTMAYLVGSFFGKTPFSAISPKKTWEGTAGGALLTIVAATIWGHYSQDYTIIDGLALALCASVAGTAGDLFESKLKRLAGVKDSGAIMPGHGGVLDRFDSLLAAAPFAFAYAYLCM